MKTVIKTTLCVILTVNFVLSLQAGESDKEKVLFSFEREEVEKIAQNKKDIAKFSNGGDFIFFPPEPIVCTQEKTSQGKYSCKVVEELSRNVSDFSGRRVFRSPSHRLWLLWKKEPQANLLLGQILNTGGWYGHILPKDWTGWDLLRVDVCVETAEQVKSLMLEVEDNLVEPPVSLTFEAPPAGKWVTLEMDLNRAVEERKLDLKNMAHIWIRVEMKNLEETTRRMHKLVRDPAGKEELEKLKFRAYVDNIRLAKKDAVSVYPVLKGERSVYTVRLPRSYAVEEHMLKEVFPEPVVIPTELPPVQEGRFGINLMQRLYIFPASKEMPQEVKNYSSRKKAIKQIEPSVVLIREMIVKGCMDVNPANSNIYNSVWLSGIAAASSEHILIGFYIFSMGSLRAGFTAQVPLGRWCTAAVGTLDGGKTWKGLDGYDWPTVMGEHISKVLPRLTDIGDNIGGVWQLGRGGLEGVGGSDYPVDMMFFVRTALTEKGYWKSHKYFVSGDPRHCHNVGSGDLVVDQSGRIWGVLGGLDRFSSWRFASVFHSASTWVYYSDDGVVTWTSWRGTGFNGAIPFVSDRQVRIVPYRGNVAVIGSKGWTYFDGKEWSKVQQVEVGDTLCDVVACGEQIFVSDNTGPVKVFDGKEWNPFSIPGRSGARRQIGVCGWKKVVFIETDDTGKKLLYWQKDGEDWRGAKEIVTETKPIVQVRVQRYAPEGFIPLSYMCISENELPKGKKNLRYSLWFQPVSACWHTT